MDKVNRSVYIVKRREYCRAVESVHEGLTQKRDAIVRRAYTVFYEGGFHASGVDSLLEGSGISKRTLYKYFKSKEELIGATIAFYHENMFRTISAFIESGDARNPVSKILRLYDWLDGTLKSGHRAGCFAINAKLEYANKEAAIERSCENYFARVEEMLANLCHEAGCKGPKKLARQLALIFQGAVVNGQITHDEASAQIARAAAKVLIEAAAS
jgi:AcrR family transcriptional regulator